MRVCILTVESCTDTILISAKFISNLWKFCAFLGTQICSTNKIDHHEILLKVAPNATANGSNIFDSLYYTAQWVRSLDLTTHTCLSPILHRLTPGFVNYKKGCIQLAVASDKVYQLLVHGRWFSPGTPASSTTKTGRHDIAEILLKVVLKHQKSNQITD